MKRNRIDHVMDVKVNQTKIVVWNISSFTSKEIFLASTIPKRSKKFTKIKQQIN